MASGHAAVHHLTPFGSNLFPHEARANDRRLVIRLDVYEPVGLVQRLRFAHVRQCVEPELRILQTPALVPRPPDHATRRIRRAGLRSLDSPADVTYTSGARSVNTDLIVI